MSTHVSELKIMWIIEAVLMAADEPISLADLQQLLADKYALGQNDRNRFEKERTYKLEIDEKNILKLKEEINKFKSDMKNSNVEI